MTGTIDFGVKMPTKPKEAKEVSAVFSDEDIETIIKDAENKVPSNNLVCLVIGQDGSGKTGIVMDYLETLPKKSIIIDVDGGCEPLKASYHKGSKKVIIIDPVEMKTTEKDVEFDYNKTVAKIKAFIKYVKDNKDNFSAIVIDGISTGLKMCEHQMRIDKHIAPDGGVQMRYWIQRNKRFTEMLDAAKSIQGIDKIFIGHEDFIVKEDAAAVKTKTNQMIHQRIICKKDVEKNTQKMPTGNVKFSALIDKSKYNLAIEGNTHVFATKDKEGKTTWDAKPIFEGLK